MSGEAEARRNFFYADILFGLLLGTFCTLLFLGVLLLLSLPYGGKIPYQNTAFSGQFTMTEVMDRFCQERMFDSNARATSFNPHYSYVAMNCLLDKDGWTKYNNFDIEDFCSYAGRYGLRC